jgi:hypothetical protein
MGKKIKNVMWYLPGKSFWDRGYANNVVNRRFTAVPKTVTKAEIP